MNDQMPHHEACLTDDERDAVNAAWRQLQARMQPFAHVLDRSAGVDCGDLHAAFMRLEEAFDTLEQSVMRAQQIRLLAGQSNAS